MTYHNTYHHADLPDTMDVRKSPDKPLRASRNALDAAYLRGAQDGMAGRKPSCPAEWRDDRTLCALYAAGWEAYSLAL